MYPDAEPPVLGTFFDMDVSMNREVEIMRNAYLTVRVNEAATDHGYAWIAPTLDLKCVDLVDENYGDFATGYIQYLFVAKDVRVHCTDSITLTRSDSYTDCPGCNDIFKISVSIEVATDPTATVVTTTTIDPTDPPHVQAAKTTCDDDDQMYWSANLNACINKCTDTKKPWWNTAANECQ